MNGASRNNEDLSDVAKSGDVNLKNVLYVIFSIFESLPGVDGLEWTMAGIWRS